MEEIQRGGRDKDGSIKKDGRDIEKWKRYIEMQEIQRYERDIEIGDIQRDGREI